MQHALRGGVWRLARLSGGMTLKPSRLRIATRLPLSAAATERRRTTAAERGADGREDRRFDQKEAVLEKVVKEINTRYGKGSLMKLGSMPKSKTETLSSGALTLDIALGGGFPKGRIVEIFGPESSGKSTLALHAMAEAQKKGGIACLVDAEHAFDEAYAKALGMDVDNMYLCQPECGEMALQAVDLIARSGGCSIICIDSVSALTPKAEIEGEVGIALVGTQARLMSQALRKIAGNAAKMGCTILFLNQIRYKVGVFGGNPETTSGGQALKFYSSVRLEIRRKEQITSAGEVTGIRVKCKVVKNKCAAPFKRAELDIMFGSGINILASTLDAAEMCDVVAKKGSWYYWGDEKLGQGREKVIAFLEENPEKLELIEIATRAHSLDGHALNVPVETEVEAEAGGETEFEEIEDEVLPQAAVS